MPPGNYTIWTPSPKWPRSQVRSSTLEAQNHKFYAMFLLSKKDVFPALNCWATQKGPKRQFMGDLGRKSKNPEFLSPSIILANLFAQPPLEAWKCS